MESDRVDEGQYVFFSGGHFSQWAKHEMEVDGVVYVTCEQYMMAGKARLFGDLDTLAAIMASNNPRTQKSLGRRVKPFDVAMWEGAREEIVYRGNLAKFTQNPELRELLLSTGDKIIAEASPWDSIWGIGMAESDPRILDTSQWGQNLLGKALMRVRETLRTEH